MAAKILYKILAWISKRFLKKYKPIIIGITGSVGKSSTKEAIYIVLKDHINTRRNIKNYNNEIGVPLTILGRHSPARNIIGWLRVFWMSLGSIIFTEKSYPKVLILEMAADRIGDIEYLINIAPLNRGVITAISLAHTEFLGTLENITKEKQIIVTSLPDMGWAFLNADDELVMGIKDKISTKIITFGISESADIRAIEIKLEQEIDGYQTKIYGLRVKINYKGSIVPMFLPGFISRTQIYAVLAALAVGLTFDMNLIEMADNLKEYESLPGRMKPINGINNSLIIDDTYNSSPDAVYSALQTLKQINIHPNAKKWVVLGDMRELGSISQEQHYEQGKIVAQMNFDYLVTVGEEAKEIAAGARRSVMGKEKIFSFDNSKEAGQFIKDRVKNGDAFLIKGSQSVRMEKIVKKIMLRPKTAKRLLIRQGDEWLD